MFLETHTLIVSDTHLGSPLARSKELLQLLQQSYFKRLILLGDIFDDLNFDRLDSDAWELLSFIRKISNKKRGKEVIWVKGNHDEKLTHVMSHLVGIKVFEEYMWHFNDKKYLAVHGDIFDTFIARNPICTLFARLIYVFIDRMNIKHFRITLFLDRLHTSWLKLSDKVAMGAARYARSKDIDVVFCGHTHEAMTKSFDDNGRPLQYFNTGCWINEQNTFITIDERGVQLRKFPLNYIWTGIAVETLITEKVLR